MYDRRSVMVTILSEGNLKLWSLTTGRTCHWGTMVPFQIFKSDNGKLVLDCLQNLQLVKDVLVNSGYVYAVRTNHYKFNRITDQVHTSDSNFLRFTIRVIALIQSNVFFSYKYNYIQLINRCPNVRVLTHKQSYDFSVRWKTTNVWVQWRKWSKLCHGQLFRQLITWNDIISCAFKL